MEKSNREKEKWYERTVEKKLLDADKDLDEVNDALHNLRTATEDLEEDKQPTLDEYYKPSDEMRKYMDIARGVLGLGSGYLFTKLLP